MTVSEEQMIRAIAKFMPRSDRQLNAPFESDAEVVKWGDGNLFVSTDEFSEEDAFREYDPHCLGWNCAAGAISDIYAAGGIPKYYLHSLVVSQGAGTAWAEKFSRGTADLLSHCDVSFLGGDFGRSASWRCTATVIGEGKRPLLRSGARQGDILYLSGPLGGGNLEAMLKIYVGQHFMEQLTKPVRFRIEPRRELAEVVREYASACIDTSDGGFLGLSSLADCSKAGVVVRDIPYEPKAMMAARLKNLPVELLFLCEAGEYELLFSIPDGRDEAFQEELKKRNLAAHRVGYFCEPGRLELVRGRQRIDLSSMVPRAREYESKRKYVEDVKTWFEAAEQRG